MGSRPTLVQLGHAAELRIRRKWRSENNVRIRELEQLQLLRPDEAPMLDR
jgi:hypothetical protein